MTRAGIHVAFLRGVNVGGKNRLPMKDLAAMFTAAGCDGVRTYIQSGNVVFEASPAVARRIPALVAKSIAARFRFDTTLVIRSAAELGEVSKRNPFLKRGADLKTLHVGFLADTPSKDGLGSLDPKRSPPDHFVVLGREVYFCLPNGMAKTKLTTQYFDSRLGTTMTSRNWNTVLRLVEMAEAK